MSHKRGVPVYRQVMALATSSAATAALLLAGCGGDETGVAGTTTNMNPAGGGSTAGTADGGAAPTTTGTPGMTTGTTGATTGSTAGGATSTTGATTGGSTDANTTGGTAEAGPSCDVAAIFANKCQSCHGAELVAGAPMPLITHADFQGMGPITMDKTILTLVGERIRDPQRPMPPDNSLTEEEKVAIEGWLAAGAPSDDGQGCGDTGGTTGGTTGEDTGTEKVWPPPDATECYEILSHASGDKDAPMMVRAGTETHPQIIHDAPWGSEAMQAVGFRSITDNASVLHHWILYDNSGGGGALGAPFITGWAPGKNDEDLPDDVAMYLPSGPQSLRLDMHYYNVGSGEDQPDSSGVEICVAPAGTRQNTSTVFMGFSNIAGLQLPPQQETDIVSYCTVQGSDPVTAMSVSPHMHEYGRHSKLEVKRADTGEIETWHDAGFAFEDQKVYPLNKTLYPGDVVKTTCTFENTSSQLVTFGENTGDEMCFNFVAYYPMDSFSCSEGLLGGLLGGGMTW